MGVEINHNIIVEGWSEERVRELHDKAKGLGLQCVTPVIVHAINGGAGFAILSEGSKEGWDMRDEEQERRERFLAIVREKMGAQALEVAWGGDMGKQMNDEFEEGEADYELHEWVEPKEDEALS